jgi:signal transduction histidine kinase
MDQLRQVPANKLCSLAHEINNQLGVIAGYSELMLEHAEADSECAKRLRTIVNIVHSLAKRINGQECRMVSDSREGWPNVATTTTHVANADVKRAT